MHSSLDQVCPKSLISLLFDRGLASELPHGATVINHATGDPKEAEAVSHRLAEYDLNYLDAPVSGGRPSPFQRAQHAAQRTAVTQPSARKATNCLYFRSARCINEA
jgi:hypothetical protein